MAACPPSTPSPRCPPGCLRRLALCSRRWTARSRIASPAPGHRHCPFPPRQGPWSVAVHTRPFALSSGAPVSLAEPELAAAQTIALPDALPPARAPASGRHASEPQVTACHTRWSGETCGNLARVTKRSGSREKRTPPRTGADKRKEPPTNRGHSLQPQLTRLDRGFCVGCRERLRDAETRSPCSTLPRRARWGDSTGSRREASQVSRSGARLRGVVPPNLAAEEVVTLSSRAKRARPMLLTAQAHDQ